MINYENGIGWDYRFRTISVPTPTPTPNDTTPPVVTGISVSPQAVDVSDGPQTVQVIYTATDDISGVAHNTGYVSGLVFTSPSSAQAVKINAGTFVLTSGTAQNGQHSGTATFPQFAESGAWQLTSMLVEDGAGNLLSLGSATIENLGLNLSLEITSVSDTTHTPTAIPIPAYSNWSLIFLGVSIALIASVMVSRRHGARESICSN